MRTLIQILVGLLVVGCGGNGEYDAVKSGERDSRKPSVDNEAKPSPSGNTPKSLPQEVVEAWKKAGFRLGWLGEDKLGQYGTVEWLEKLREPSKAKPAFIVEKWKPGVLLTLPNPQSSFGLNLSASGITDSDCKEVARFQQLTSLELISCEKVTDAGLMEVAKLQNLTLLALDGNNITDQSIKNLIGLKQLTKLSISGTKITNAGLIKLRESMPKCIVVKVY